MKVILLENVWKVGSIGEIIDVKRGYARNFLISKKKLSTENRELYGSVKPTEISKILKETDNVEINPSMIQPNKEIKSLGTFEVTLNLHSDIQTQIKITVLNQEEN